MRSFRERNPVRIGLASLAALSGLLALAFSLNRLPFVSNTYRLTAEFADAAGLSRDNEVRVAGIKVGRVRSVELAGDRVIVSMDIDAGVEIPSDSRAEISLKTILGQKFVTIDARGTGRPLGDGGRIPLAQTAIPFEIYQVANAAVDLLSGVDGERLSDAFDALADVTADPNRNLARTLEGAGRVLEGLASRRTSIDQAIRKGEQVLEALDRSSPQIEAILEHTGAVLEVLSRRRAVVQRLLRNTEMLAGELAGLLSSKRPELDSILDDLHATLAIVDAHLGQVEQAIRLLGPSTEAFARIVWNGRWASICTMAAEAGVLPPPLPAEVEIGTGKAGGPAGPLDCPSAAAASPAGSPGSGSRRGGVQP